MKRRSIFFQDKDAKNKKTAALGPGHVLSGCYRALNMSMSAANQVEASSIATTLDVALHQSQQQSQNVPRKKTRSVSFSNTVNYEYFNTDSKILSEEKEAEKDGACGVTEPWKLAHTSQLKKRESMNKQLEAAKRSITSNPDQQLEWFYQNILPMCTYGNMRQSTFMNIMRQFDNFYEDVFRLFDTDGIGFVTAEELIGGFRKLVTHAIHESQIAAIVKIIFKYSDKENNTMTSKDFRLLLQDRDFQTNFYFLFQQGPFDNVSTSAFCAGIERLAET